jgi:hypothetical protein
MIDGDQRADGCFPRWEVPQRYNADEHGDRTWLIIGAARV